MKGAPSSSARVPSPTPTSYSGISNYRTDSFKPVGKNGSNPDFPPLDVTIVARTHFDELSRYLASYLAKEPANSRSSARQKLTRLTKQQFQELSTDVYDELMRRTNNSSDNEVPFLPVRDDFHPKRNQARQKLATLPTSRFKDLSSDVYFELARRYPDFKEEEHREPTQESTYDDYPSPEFPNNSRQVASSSGDESRRRPSQDTASPVPGRRPSENEYGRRNGAEDPSRKESINNFSSRRKQSDATSVLDRRNRPSQDTTASRRSEDRAADREFHARKHSESVSSASDATSNIQSATSGMVIPNKSTIAEEEIEVPYGRQIRDSGSTATGEGERNHERDLDGERDVMSHAIGLNGLSSRFKQNDDDGNDSSVTGGDDYFDKMSFGRASVTSDRSPSKAAGGEEEGLRREYEYKIATMQSKIAELERDLGSADEKRKKGDDGEVRIREMEEELIEFRRRAEAHGQAMRALQKELEELREDRARDREREARRRQQDEDELQILRKRCEKLEEERDSGYGADPLIIEQLRGDMEGLVTELSDLSRRNDELMTGKDADLAVIRDLDVQLKEYKRKYEQAKTELRSIKATSQLFLQAPKTEDQLPVSPNGGILDIHVTAFVSGLDSLLTAGRTNSPTRVLTPMKAVVNAVSAIIEDLRHFERISHPTDVNLDSLRTLRERAEATLSNLVAATRTHATSSGMSPVSLLDAAASHVSSTVTEIAKLVFIRKATQAEQEEFLPAPIGHLPSIRSIDEVKMQHNRTTSSQREDIGKPNVASRSGTSLDDDRRTFSDLSSSEDSTPPPIFDRPSTTGILSDDSAPAEGPEDAWNELKPYLDAQSDSIVVAIQSVLSGVRSPTPPQTLNENVTQIITIVASIVAVCKDNLPPRSVQQGKEFLMQLSDHANKLSEVQALPEVTKESRQIMARSSFAIANIMKSLGKMT